MQDLSPLWIAAIQVFAQLFLFSSLPWSSWGPIAQWSASDQLKVVLKHLEPVRLLPFAEPSVSVLGSSSFQACLSFYFLLSFSFLPFICRKPPSQPLIGGELRTSPVNSEHIRSLQLAKNAQRVYQAPCGSHFQNLLIKFLDFCQSAPLPNWDSSLRLAELQALSLFFQLGLMVLLSMPLGMGFFCLPFQITSAD